MIPRHLTSHWKGRLGPILIRQRNKVDTFSAAKNGILLRRFSSAGEQQQNAESSPCTILKSLPWQFLRMSDSSNYDPVTMQRNDVSFDLHDGRPIKRQQPKDTSTHVDVAPSIRTCLLEENVYKIEWDDGLCSKYSSEWVQEQLDYWKKGTTGRVFWEGMTEDELRTSRSVNFDDLLTPDGQSKGLRSLFEYGILLVTSTPIHDDGAGIAAMASALGGGSVKTSPTILHHYKNGGREVSLPRGTDGPLRTLYGTVWSTSTAGQEDGASVADSAYGHEGLPLHTDMTYLRDPPGLQIFTMVQPAVNGGESVFADGFAAAERLRNADSEAFDTLSQTIRRYRSMDRETGWHLEASGPVISLRNGMITAIRHNDLDRLPDLPSPGTADVDEFYDRLDRAHDSWDEILAMDDLRLTVKLQPGDTVVVANQRCFHGRYSFEVFGSSGRSVMGCYVSQDEVDSRFRMERFRP